MPTQGERQNYLWRPNDNSATTRVRYDLEAEHWMRSFNDAAQKNKPFMANSGGGSGPFFVIGLVIELAFTLIYLLFVLIGKLFTWLLREKPIKPTEEPQRYRCEPLSHDELRDRINNGKLKTINIYED